MMQRVVFQLDSRATDLGAQIIVGGTRTKSKVHCSHTPLRKALQQKPLTSPTLQRGCLQRCSAAPQTTFSVSDLPPETAAAWQEVATRLETLGLTPPQAEKCMIKASLKGGCCDPGTERYHCM